MNFESHPTREPANNTYTNTNEAQNTPLNQKIQQLENAIKESSFTKTRYSVLLSELRENLRNLAVSSFDASILYNDDIEMVLRDILALNPDAVNEWDDRTIYQFADRIKNLGLSYKVHPRGLPHPQQTVSTLHKAEDFVRDFFTANPPIRPASVASIPLKANSRNVDIVLQRMDTELQNDTRINQDIAKLRGDLGSVAYRARIIDTLNKRILEAKSPKQTYSPYIEAQKKNIELLNDVLLATEKQIDELEKIHEECSQAKSTQPEIIHNFDQKIADIDAYIDKTQRTIAELNDKVSIRSKLFMFGENSKIGEVLTSEPRKLVKFKEMIKDRTDPAIQDIMDFVTQLEDIRNSMIAPQLAKFADVSRIYSQTQQALFQAQFNKNLESWLEKGKQEEMRAIGSLVSPMTSAQNSLQFERAKEWATRLDAAVASFEELASNRLRIENELMSLNSTPSNGELLSVYEEKGKELIELKKELDELQYELAEKKEELYKTAQNLQIYPMSDIEFRNRQRSEHYYRCPICKKNPRDKIIETCGHAICESCLNSSEGICPKCSRPYSHNAVHSFYFQS